MRKLRIAHVLTTAAALAPLFAGCAASVTDNGKWGDLAEGGDVNKLHDAGTYCASWSPSDYSPPPLCNTQHDGFCREWAQNAFPPSLLVSSDPTQCLKDDGAHTAHCTSPGEEYRKIQKCNPGEAGDAYCEAFYEAWMPSGVRVNAKCWDGTCESLDGNKYPCPSCYVECGHTQHSSSLGGYYYDPPGTCPGPDGLSMCVIEHDGSIACQELCSDTPSGPPAKP
jgi:hypothetical protein